MGAVHVGYSTRRGWSLLDAATFERSRGIAGVWWFTRKSLTDSDPINVVVHGSDAGQGEDLSARARRWLLDEGLARMSQGRLIVDEVAVAARLAGGDETDKGMAHHAPTPDETADESGAGGVGATGLARQAPTESNVTAQPLLLPERIERPKERTRIVSNKIDLADGVGMTIEDMIGRSWGLLGITGSGKSNTFAVVIEEIAPFMPFVIFDTAGEYHGLRERIPVVIFGKVAGPTVDVALLPGQGGKAADFSIRERVPVILDLSEFDDDDGNDERMLLVESFLKRLWVLTGRPENQRPYLVGIEEAHNYVPQQGSTPVKALIRRIATEGRKRGLSLLLASQRSAAVEKGVLTQCHTLVLHHVMHDVDLQRYVDAVPSALMAKNEVREVAFNLAQGEALLLRSKTVQRVVIRRRHTRHGGHTPGLGDVQQVMVFDAPQLDPAMLERLRGMFGGAAAGGDEDVDALRARVAQLEGVLVERNARIVQLEAMLAGGVNTDGGADVAPVVITADAPLRVPTGDSLTVEDMVARRADEAAKVERKRQERAVDQLVTRVRMNLTGHRRDFVKLLAACGKLSQREAVKRLSIKASTFRAPLEMLEAGLVTKTGHGLNAIFEWRAWDKLAAQYPALDAGVIIERILR